jgi:hypothetical protein
MKKLLQSQSATYLRLVLETDHWLAVADEIRQGHCNLQTLILVMCRVAECEATESVKVVVSANQVYCNLEQLTLRMENGFKDETGLALAEALTVNHCRGCKAS